MARHGLTSGRKKGIVIATIGLFLIIGFGTGVRNDLLLKCGIFQDQGETIYQQTVSQ
jgi:hypothetical protein